WFLEVSRIGGAAYVVSLPRRIKAPRGPGRSGRVGRDWRGLLPGLPAPALLRRPVIVLAAPLTRIDGGRRRIALLEEEAKAVAAPVPAPGAATKGVAARDDVGRRRRRLARDEPALGLVAEHRDEFGAIIGLAAQRLVRDDDRGARYGGRCDAVEHILRDGDGVERVLGVVAIIDGDDAPAQALVALLHGREDMRADRLVGIADGDGNLDAGIEHLAAVRPGLVGIASHVELLRGAADVDR